MISAVVLTRSKDNAKKTLESLRWCDEVIVLEKDNLTDYALQRNLGLQKAKNDWVLFVDDDEMVSEELKLEMLKQVQHDTDSGRGQNDTHCHPDEGQDLRNGYFIKRKDFFLGKKLNFGETGNIKLLRLGRKGAGMWHRKVHEFWDIKNTAILKNPLYHYPHQTIKQFIDSINLYTNLDSQELNKENKNFGIFRLLFNPLGKFIQNYFFKLGFLDGFPGFVMAFMMSMHSLIVRVKQYETH